MKTKTKTTIRIATAVVALGLARAGFPQAERSAVPLTVIGGTPYKFYRIERIG